ncbi:MAG: hypothetical protein RLZZ122_181 [Actinomycetota bacterium]
MSANEFGRVDDKNSVYLIDQGTERLVGQYPNVSSDEAMAFFVRKFEDLEAQVRILEQRIANGVTDAKSLKATHATLTKEISEPKGVGNYDSLRYRLSRIYPAIEEAIVKANAAKEEAIVFAMAEKEKIAQRAEELVSNLGAINWKKSGEEMAELFAKWQQLQKDSPKIAKSLTDPVWKRFSQARAKFEAGKRKYFAVQDAKFKEAKKIKTELTEKAKSLVDKGAQAAAEYKKLQAEWKKAGKAGKLEEALWESFRAAGDAIFLKKKEQDDQLATSHAENLKGKLALLEEAEAIDTADLKTARSKIGSIQARWSKFGHVPKDQVKSIEGRLRAVESKIASAEKEAWQRSDPAAKARSSSLVSQLEAVIANLEKEMVAAPEPKKKEIQSQIESRKALLVAAQNAVD